jgi:uncharacterized protein (TIGR02145 family)
MKQLYSIYTIVMMGVLLLFVISCKKEDNAANDTNGDITNTFTDPRDGNNYNIITIGDQIWMAENLKFLPRVVGSGSGSISIPYYYVYGYNSINVADAKSTSNYNTYGVLYNWEAAKNACPKGWHLPSNEEWTQMAIYLADNGYNYDGTIGKCCNKIAKAMASAHYWEFNKEIGSVGNTDYPAFRNKSGFTALPGGLRFNNDSFDFMGFMGCWWSATIYDSHFAAVWKMSSNFGSLEGSDDYKDLGLSVRCVKD